MSFENDTQGKNTHLYPIVTIEPPNTPTTWPNHYPDVIHLSTNSVSLDHIHLPNTGFPDLIRQVHFKPLLLNIPSIKESINVESRKFKISNVRLDISNYEYNGERFSDKLADTSLLNWKCSVQFVSPTANKFSTIFSVDDYATKESFYDHYIETGFAPQMTKMIYQGVIRRISHDDTKVSIQLEDLTEQKIHKLLPQQSVGSTEGIPDKYKNKPIPMVYGRVSRSPVVMPSFEDLTIDYKDIEGLVESSNHDIFTDQNVDSMYIAVDNGYVNLPKTIEKQILGSPFNISIIDSDQIDDYNLEDQWEENVDDKKVKLNHTKLFSRGGLQVKSFLKPSTPSLMKSSYESGFDDTNLLEYASNQDLQTLVDGDLNTEIPIEVSNYIDNSDFGEFFEYVSGQRDSFFVISINAPPINDLEKADNLIVALNNKVLPEPYGSLHRDPAITGSDGSDTTGITFFVLSITAYGGTNSEHVITEDISNDGTGDITTYADTSITYNDLFIFNSGDINSVADLSDPSKNPNGATIAFKTGSTFIDNAQIMFCNNGSTFEIVFFSQLGPNVTNETIPGFLDARFQELDMVFLADIKNPLDKDFYADVKGRVNTFDDNPFYYAEYLIQNPVEIIYDILRSELGLTNKQIDIDDFTKARLQHLHYQFSFTINKKTDSKKLIEDIAKSTKCFPYFANDGRFRFNSIQDSYGVSSTYDSNKTRLINVSDVIKYSFNKTKPEQIYKKVTVNYHHDYSQDSLLSSVSNDLGPDEFYNITDSNDAHLEFDCKYIRNENNTDTENNLLNFLLNQYRNDHLLLKIKLPLKYMDLEVGGIIKLRELLGGITAYGIDYRLIQNPTGEIDPDGSTVGGQYYYPLFFITSIQKKIDSVEIECMQLHHLTENSDVDQAWFDFEDKFNFPDSVGIIPEPPDDFIPVYTTNLNVDLTPIMINILNDDYPAEQGPLQGASFQLPEATASITYVNPVGDTVEANLPDGVTVSVDQVECINPSSIFHQTTYSAGTNVDFIDDNGVDYIFRYKTKFNNLVDSSFDIYYTEQTADVIVTFNHITDNPPSFYIAAVWGSDADLVFEGSDITHTIFIQDQQENYYEKYLYEDSPDRQIRIVPNDDNDPNPTVFYGADISQQNGGFFSNSLPFYDLPDLTTAGEYEVCCAVQDNIGQWSFLRHWTVVVFDPDAPVTQAGDANSDGVVNILDVVIAVNYVLAENPYDPTGELFDTIDMNQDGAVNVLDVVQIVNIVLYG